MDLILFNAISPIVLMVLLGYLLGKLRLVSVEATGPLMQYVFYAAAPAILFYAAISNPVSQLLYWKFWLGYILIIAICIVLCYLVFRHILRRGRLMSILAGFTAGMTNTVIIGYPLLKSFTGDFAALPMTVTIFVFCIIFNPLLIFAFEVVKAQKEGKETHVSSLFKNASLSTIKNPMVIAAFVGAIINVLGLPVPHFFSQFTYQVGESIVPVALLAAGLDLAHFKVKGQWADIILMSFFSLIIGPIIGFLLCFALDLPAKYALALVIFAAVPSAKTVYVIAGKYRIYHEETAAVISLTTVLAIITIPLSVMIAGHYWPGLVH